MARWENDWPTKQALRAANSESKRTSACLGTWIVVTALVFGAAADEAVRGFIFVWQVLHGGH